jgi:hypothetical protein
VPPALLRFIARRLEDAHADAAWLDPARPALERRPARDSDGARPLGARPAGYSTVTDLARFRG